MKTKNEVLLVSACMMMFFHVSEYKVMDFLSNKELDVLVDCIRDIHEEFFQ